MRYTVRATLLVSTLLFAIGASAETITIDGGIAVKDSGVTAPTRGMSMQQVESRFGAPGHKVAAVGKPPISRWEYSAFIVYFEYEHVVHSVVSTAAAP
jgi:hypothetical protein